MITRVNLAAGLAAIGLLAATGAQAAVFFNGPASGQMSTDNSYDIGFNAGAGGGASLSFVIDGFNSLDGQNAYEDDFTLSLNDVALLSGTFNLGGGGKDVVFFAPAGSTIANTSGNGTAITWTGGKVDISTPLNLAAGSNKLTFAYASRTRADGFAGFQGLGDESWDTRDIVVTGPLDDLTGNLPEPLSWALMTVGFGGIGGVLRRRRPDPKSSSRAWNSRPSAC